MARRTKRTPEESSPWSSLTPVGVVVIVLVLLGYLPPSDVDTACRVAADPPTVGSVSELLALLAWERRQK